MRYVLRAATAGVALLVASWPATAQQSFGEADSTGGGLGGQGQFNPQFLPPGQQQPGGFGGQQQPGGFGGQQQPGGFGGQQQPGGFGGGQQPGGFGGGQQPGGGGLPPQFVQVLDQLAQFERQDFGVAPTDQLHQGAMHGPTPTSIPGGQVITTRGLMELVQGRQTPFMIFDVLGGGEMLPGAVPAVQASTPGSFDDQISQQMGRYLQQATGGNTQVPLVFYCASVECWMSYNASLRAIKLGYSNVLWYRGGIAAWKYVGGPTVSAGGGFQGGGGQQPQGGQGGGQWNQGGQQGGQWNQGGQQGGQWNQGGQQGGQWNQGGQQGGQWNQGGGQWDPNGQQGQWGNGQ